jgi:integrase
MTEYSCLKSGVNGVNPPRPSRKEAKYLEDTDARHLLQELESEGIQFRTFVKLLIFTGMRRGEACGLKWEDIDLNQGVISVSRTLIYTRETGLSFELPKTESSIRKISISQNLIDTLKAYRDWQTNEKNKLADRWCDYDLVFSAWNGMPEIPNKSSQRFRAFIERSDLPNISLHALRHTNASLLISGGADLKTVSGRLGHAKQSTTFEIYTHLVNSANNRAAEIIDEILS